MERALTENEVQFFYRGLYRVLKRYRTATIMGWLIVLVGVLVVPLGWNTPGGRGLLDMALAGGTIVAGLVLVSEAVSFLEAYLSVPFPGAAERDGDETPEVLREIKALIAEIQSGGWQEAYAAIGRLEGLGRLYPVPPLDQ